MAPEEVQGLDGYPEAVGRGLWMLEDTRRRTLDAVSGLDDYEVDAVAPALDNTIGATLYHIAAIEADWLYADILCIEYPDWLREWFPFDVREEDGRLSPVMGFSAENHFSRLAKVRGHFLEDIQGLADEAYRSSNELADNPSTPQWVLHHLMQHEAEHRGQIQSIRTALRVS